MKGRRGQGIVEFALILPVLLLVILGLIEAAFLIQGYLTVQHAAREAARFAVTYQPVQGACLNDTMAPYPACPKDGEEWASEPESRYNDRRTELIKQAARRAAAGLRIDDAHLGDTPETFDQYQDLPGFFGVLVWGYPSFLTDCDANPDECLDHPGLEGLPVRVLVRHNVEIVDPLYRAVVEYVPVRANSQMINEGIQVGFGDVPPPDFSTNPDLDEPPVDPPDEDPEDPEDPPDEEQHTYFVELNVEHAENTLPEDRGHEFVATVTDELSRTVKGARVSFSTDNGGFGYSGVEPRYVELLTDGNGQASVTLFGNRPGTAAIRAWLDYDGDDTWGAGEPSDNATKTWTVTGPYIAVSDYEVYPGVDAIYADVMDHDSAENPYRLLWCVISGTTGSAVVQDPVNVDAGGDATDIVYPISADTKGSYRLETHSGLGDCDDSDLVAYTAPISVVVLPPDLTVASFDVPDLVCPETVFTMSVVVENVSPGRVDETFDVDFYLDPEFTPPSSPVGEMKQWVSGVGPNGSVVVNTLMWVETSGQHQIWARVDTSDYVDEGWNEDNNVEVITITTGSVLGDLLDTGWRNPGANAADSGGDGNGFEDRASGAYANGGDYARNYNGRDDRHRFYNYGLDVPTGSTIEGVQVRLDGWVDSTYWDRRGWYEVQLSWDGGATWSDAQSTTDLATWQGSRYVGGVNYLWGHDWTAAELSNGNFRVRITSRAAGDRSWGRDFFLDWVPVRVSYRLPGECPENHDPPPWGEEEDVRPPGLVECEQVLHVGGFEGNPQTVFSYWHAGEALAFKHQSRYIYEGSMSMRLHASMGSYPDCPAYYPHLWQTVQIPEDVYTMTTMFVRGRRLIAGSLAPCSNADSAEADDVLYVQMHDGVGNGLGERQEVANGGAARETWDVFEVDVTDAVGIQDRAGEEVQLYFDADHDEDFNDTWFYLDGIECEVCTGWPPPAPRPGTASIGGEVRVLVNGVPQRLQGVDVWAYSVGGQVYHTVTIHDATYHFYNIPPGRYTVYAETWIGGSVRFATTTVTVGADERDYGVSLFLL